MNTLSIIGRSERLFTPDIHAHESELTSKVRGARFLVIGGAGTIGQAVVKEIFKRDPAALHVVDISENNLVELVRDIRSGLGYGSGDFKTLPLDVGSQWFDAFVESEDPYDYILNLSALKHVRSEKDAFTLMRMIEVNVFNTEKTVQLARLQNAKKYFAVSTDKAANPANLMGATKRVMERFLFRLSELQPVSTARFANVAFSDGSLLHGFNQRMQKLQPLSAPNDVRRYFLIPEESGELCLLSTLLGENRDTFFPKLSAELNLITFSDIAVRYLESQGYEAVECSSEDEARAKVGELQSKKKWPVYFFQSDTTGEKPFEEFYTTNESIDLDKFQGVGIIHNPPEKDEKTLEQFRNHYKDLVWKGKWEKEEIVKMIVKAVPELEHEEKGLYLDGKM